MKGIFVLACSLTIVYGGVVPWTQSGEEYAAELFKQYCGQKDAGVNGDIHWHCKNAPPASDEYYEHKKALKTEPTVQKQVIFINTPSKKIKHKVRVDGEVSVNQDTNIYVLPPKVTHDVEITGEIKTHAENGKPHTFFLKKNPGGSDKGGYSPQPQYPQQHKEPVSSYLSQRPYDAPEQKYHRKRSSSHSHRHRHRNPTPKPVVVVEDKQDYSSE